MDARWNAGKKIKISKLTFDKKDLKEFAESDFITTRRVGKVIFNYYHHYQPTFFIATNADETQSIYSVEEVGE